MRQHARNIAEEVTQQGLAILTNAKENKEDTSDAHEDLSNVSLTFSKPLTLATSAQIPLTILLVTVKATTRVHS